MITLKCWPLVSALPRGTSPCKERVEAVSEDLRCFPNYRDLNYHHNHSCAPGQIRVWVEDTQLVRAHKNSAGTPSHSGHYWPQDSRKLCVNWEECVRIVKTEVTEPKIPHSICDVALKIITTNTKDDKEPPHHSKHCWHLISYFSLLGKKENQPLVF